MRRTVPIQLFVFSALLVASLVANGCGGGGASQSGLIPGSPDGKIAASTPTPVGASPTPTPHSTPTPHGTPTPPPTPTPRPTPTPSSPPASVASHVQDFTFWKQSGIALNVSASWMATWATFVETGGSANANAFHSAGGKFTVAYTSPNYLLVVPGYTQPGNYPESAFGHGSSGTRTQRPQGGGTEYYLNPNSAASQSGFQGVADAIAAGGGFDYIWADGISDSLGTSLFRMSPTPAEITTNSQYVNGMKQLISLSPLPVIVNGFNNGNPVTEEEYTGAAKVAANVGEECFTQDTQNVKGQQWIDMANALLNTTGRGYYAFCGGRGQLSDNRGERTYWLASWWLTYDPSHSVGLEIYSGSGDVYVFPEELIVPTNPLQSPSSVGPLQSSTGAYVRQFGACYYNRIPWGSCAAIVNPTSGSVAMPAAAAGYHHSLSLSTNDLYDGGQASLSGSVPSSLSAGSAVVLFQ